MPRCFQVNARDNVATMLEDGEKETVDVVGAKPVRIVLAEKVRSGHKVALQLIPAGEAIVKYGAIIGRAKRVIETGEWVHLHNCASSFDERSGTFDVNDGTAETKYE